uniref:Uncharacterized protein n=1 Tax=Arundo donax TaxID=35708 RepID=A0A0A9DYF6_ARUDO
MREAGQYKAPDDDPFHRLMELSLYDDRNPIKDWMENGRSNADPLLDEEDTESDAPIPSRMVVEVDDNRESQRITGTSSLAEWAGEHVGDTHIGKRKVQTLPRKQKAKKQNKKAKKRSVGSDKSTESDHERCSPSYQESGDSSSPSAFDGDAGVEGGTSAPPSTTIHFIGETEFTHATQDQDHGAPHS